MAKETRGLPKPAAAAAAGAADDGYHYSLGPVSPLLECPKMRTPKRLANSRSALRLGEGRRWQATTHSSHSVKAITAQQQHLEI